MTLARIPALPHRSPVRRMLMIGCAAAAVLGAGEAAAQSFDATSVVTQGSATVTTAPGQTNISVNSPSAVIAWQPNGVGDPFIFQPAGTTATFTGNPGFAVLNRILHNGRIQFDGTVNGRLAGVGTPGGIIAFAAPNGIILGGTSVFDVGSLILTTMEPAVGPTGEFIDATGRLVLGPGQFPPGSIEIQDGARITASREDSFVLLAGSQITQNGSVRVNGSAAYVAATAAEITYSGGLFDIVVTAGTAAGTAIVHGGTTGGPASSGGADQHRIYMVAVGEGAAVDMLLGGTVGFDAPLSAAVENGAIILSAGFDVIGDEAARSGIVSAEAGSLTANDVTATSDLTGFAATNATASGQSNFQQDLSLFAGTAATVRATGSVLQVGGNLAVVARDPSGLLDPTGGIATVETLAGGQITVAGNANVDAAGVVSIPTIVDVFADAVAGTAQVRADSGSITVNGDLRVNADGLGTTTEAIPDVGGSGFGGIASVTTAQGGTVTVAGNLEATARARAQDSGGNPTTPPIASGGTVIVQTQTGSIDVAGTTRLAADARGGAVSGAVGVSAGVARGGAALIDASDGQIVLAGVTTIDATARGGFAPAGGDAVAGGVTVQASNGSIQLADGSSIDASARGGRGQGQPGGAGGEATAGDIVVRALDGAGPSTITGGGLTLVATGEGGDAGGGNAAAAVAAGTGGLATGGNILVQAGRRNGNVQLGAVTANVSGMGGTGGGGDAGQQGGVGGQGRGGSVSVGTVPEEAPAPGASAGSLQLASLAADASGSGGNGGSNGTGIAGPIVTGGTGVAGVVTIAAESAPATITGTATVNLDGRGGRGGSAGGTDLREQGSATGGRLVVTASADAAGNAGALAIGRIDASLDAEGGPSSSTRAGFFRIATDGSPITLGDASVSANGTDPSATRQASDVDLRGGALTISGTGSLQSDGDLRFAARDSGRLAGGTVALRSNANISVDHVNRVGSSSTIDVTDLTFDSAGNFTSGAGTLIRGATSATVLAGNLASFGDRLVGQRIAVTSAAIEILDSGRLGEAATQQVRLNSRTPGARIGGDNAGTGYVLSGVEVGRITGTELRIGVPAATGPANRPADVVVRDVTIDSNQVRQFAIDTPGIVQVEGALLMSNAQPTSLVEIGGTPRAQRIQVITPGGSIRVRNGSGAPGGILRLSAGDIWVTGQATFDQLIVDPNFAGRNAALLANGGPVDPRGYVEAFDVFLTPLSTLFVQNSGTATDFGGITVGSNTLTINAGAPSAPADVYAFGRGIRADGSMSTGTTFFFEAVYNGDYTVGSELNLCNIPTRTCPAPPPPEGPGIANPTPTSEEIERPVGDPQTPLNPLDDDDEPFDSATAEPLIEEPVTSGGDSSAWTEDDEDDDDDDEEKQPRQGRSPRGERRQ